MLLDLDKTILKIDGSEFDNSVTLAQAISNRLFENCKDYGLEPIKFVPLAQKLYAEGKVEVDEADLSKIEQFLKDNKELASFVIAQALQEVANARNASNAG